MKKRTHTLIILVALAILVSLIGCDMGFGEFIEGEDVVFNDTGDAPIENQFTVGYVMELPSDPTKSGYTFGGWYTDTAYTTIWDIDNDRIDKTLNLYAKWTANTYTVTFNKQNGSGGPASTTATFDDAMPSDVTAPTRTGYTFGGYYDETDGNGTQYYTDSMVSSNEWDKATDTELYAKWTANTYAVSYNANDATSGTKPSDQTKTYGIDLTLATNSGSLAKTGYTFDGWNTAADGNGTDYATVATYTTNAALTLYAKWTAKIGELGPSGGYVFYDDEVGFDIDNSGTIEDDEKDLLDGNNDGTVSGDRYLETAPYGWYDNAEDPFAQWGTMSDLVDNISDGIGTGESNTNAIVEEYGNTTYGIRTCSAKLCADYSKTVSGTTYDDWFLPSKDELNVMYVNLHVNGLGGFEDDILSGLLGDNPSYWSSSQTNSSAAKDQWFSDGIQYSSFKNSYSRVRPIRAF